MKDFLSIRPQLAPREPIFEPNIEPNFMHKSNARGVDAPPGIDFEFGFHHHAKQIANVQEVPRQNWRKPSTNVNRNWQNENPG